MYHWTGHFTILFPNIIIDEYAVNNLPQKDIIYDMIEHSAVLTVKYLLMISTLLKHFQLT